MRELNTRADIRLRPQRSGCGRRARLSPTPTGPAVAFLAVALLAAPALALEIQESPAPATQIDRPTAVAPARSDSAELVDRIAAIVGDTAILYSDVVISIYQSGKTPDELPPPGSPAFDELVRTTLDDLVSEMVILKKARSEEIEVSDDLVNQESDNRFREIRNSFASATAFQEAVTQSGQTLVQYRQMLRSQVYGRALVESYISQNRSNLPPVSVSEEEIQEVFEEFYEGQTRGAEVAFEQLVLEPKPSDAAEDSARAQAEKALQEIVDGESFEVVARRYSQDPGSRSRGGELGWMRRSDLVPAFAEAAWSARTGEPIGPVRSAFGYHIIKVENVRGGERNLRHILLRPEITQADAERTLARGEALADSIRGGASVALLAEELGAANIPITGELPVEEIEPRLGKEYADALANRKPGDVVGPFFTTRLIPGRPTFVIARMTEFRPEGTFSLDEVREEVRSRLSFNKGYERFLEELRDEVFVQILY